MAARNEAHTTTNVLIAATYLADRLLGDADQDRFLPDAVPGDAAAFDQVNWPVKTFRALLKDSRHGIGAIALPYAIALYNDYLVDALALVLLAGVSPPADKRTPGLAALHNFLKSNCDISLEHKQQMHMFEVVRHLRNCVVHGTGIVTDELAEARRTLRDDAPDAERDWMSVTKHRLPMFKPGDRIKLGPFDARGAIYAAANLAKELNVAVFDWLPNALVADIVVAHYRHVRLDKDWTHTRREQELPKFHSRHYARVMLSSRQLRDAAGRSTGPWPRALEEVTAALHAEAESGKPGPRKRLLSAQRVFGAAPSLPVLSEPHP